MTNCYSVFRIDLFEDGEFATFVYEVFNSNFHILKVLSQLFLKIIMYYRKILF